MLHWLRLLLILLTWPVFCAGCSKKPAKADDSAATPAVSAAAAAGAAKPATSKGPPLKIAYSDWPGWVAWDIAVRKGWFKEAGVDVELVWFEYVPSMEAFTAGKVDACV